MNELGLLAERGLLGLLLSLSIIANIYQYKKGNELHEKRLEDAKSYKAAFLEPLTEIRRMIGYIYDSVQSGKK